MMHSAKFPREDEFFQEYYNVHIICFDYYLKMIFKLLVVVFNVLSLHCPANELDTNRVGAVHGVFGSRSKCSE